MGLIVYFTAFIIEEPADRWNLPTLVNSVSNAFLIGILPFIFFTVINYLILKSPETTFKPNAVPAVNQPAEEMLQIKSQLKKESLYIFPDQVMYVESESNYVKFYLLHDNKIQKKVIRSSITNIEKQLSLIPYMFRTHRAFIVNLKYVRSQKGNSLGYRLRLRGIETEIPVSRNRTKEFSKIIAQYM